MRLSTAIIGGGVLLVGAAAFWWYFHNGKDFPTPHVTVRDHRTKDQVPIAGG
jgi:hypothetical protein